jgi:hypothetical protein
MECELYSSEEELAGKDADLNTHPLEVARPKL